MADLNKHIFNIHDLILVLIMFQCIVLSILLLTTSQGKKASNILLCLFLVGVGLDAWDTLIYWSSIIKYEHFKDSIQIFFIFKVSVFIAAPALYLYVKSVLYSDYDSIKQEWKHAIPVLLFPIFLVALYHNLGEKALWDAKTDFDILFNNPFFHGYIMARHAVFIFYGGLSIRLLHKYREKIQESFSDIEKIDASWLKILVMGFVSIWVYYFVAYLLHFIIDMSTVGDIVGKGSNYLTFIFINTLVFYSLMNTNMFKGIKKGSDDGAANLEPVNLLDKHHISALTRAMENDKLYLNPEITLEQLAAHTRIAVRNVSTVINRNFEKNFFEFINYYRIEHAKKLLSGSDEGVSMLDIMNDSGFNSKSSFNRFFKKYAQMTPSEYRKRQRAEAAE